MYIPTISKPQINFFSGPAVRVIEEVLMEMCNLKRLCTGSNTDGKDSVKMNDI